MILNFLSYVGFIFFRKMDIYLLSNSIHGQKSN